MARKKWERKIEAGITRLKGPEREAFNRSLDAATIFVENFMQGVLADFQQVASGGEIPTQDVFPVVFTRLHALLHEWEAGRVRVEFVGAVVMNVTEMLMSIGGIIAEHGGTPAKQF